jgi:hypothetical protein
MFLQRAGDSTWSTIVNHAKTRTRKKPSGNIESSRQYKASVKANGPKKNKKKNVDKFTKQQLMLNLHVL